MSERAKIRNAISLKLSKELKDTVVFEDPKEINISDFPCVFVSTPNEEIHLKAQPDLISRELEIHIQGFITGQSLSIKADKTVDKIEKALNKFNPVLQLVRINFEMDVLGEHEMCAFLMVYETEYEEKIWNQY
jgi:hypothetical protein